MGQIPGQVAQLEPGAGRQVEHCAIDQADFDPPAGCDLDDVTLANGIAGHGLKGDAARTRNGAAAERRMNNAYHSRQLA
ncbi:hypothetical protein [Bradyrhizobium sp. JR3.5]